MNADTDLQVWLETQAQPRPGVIVPYVQSSHSTNLRYLLRTTVVNGGGSSGVSQGGALNVPAGTAVALPRLAISQSSGECLIELVLTESKGAEKRYEFDCSTQRPAASQ
ncbi:curli-like amyloid fiber formation chaperone CsgH [Pusillimonas sp.]|uniref:curli-like amyloid fiber formation chaperone CsgH n=1 Tax=Pusillimonas sp. TaxID=3040095 RepID=UPI0029BAEC93|nr:curli-like amyloid fiber formation chaperone CsgH [Pusillimonas sp.]MDX3893313.1 curli-like amyloid fiber formation chaperone CsgH [Pusillimonas sp.]